MLIASLVIYVVVLLVTTALSYRRSPSLDDFVMAGRSVSLVPLLFTTWVANFGGGAIVGWTGGFYRYGIDWVWLPLGFLLALIFTNILATEKISDQHQFTLPDLLVVRYGERLRRISSLLCMLVAFLAMGFQVLAFAAILLSLADIPLALGMVIATLIFMVTTAVGGLTGIIRTDVIQGAIILVGMIAAAVVVLLQVGGPFQLWARLPAQYTDWGEFTRSGQAFGDGFSIFGAIATSQVLFQKIMAARDSKVARRMMWWLVPVFAGTYLVLAILGFSAHILLGPGLTAEAVVGSLIKTRVPTVLAAILLATLLGVITTTANAVLLSIGANLGRDIYQPMARRRNWPDRSVLVVRITVVVVALLALGMALWVADILRMMMVCFWIAGVVFLVPLYLGFLWKRGTATAAIASMVVGAVGVAASAAVIDPARLHPTVIGSLSAVVVYVALSLRESPAHQQVQEGG